MTVPPETREVVQAWLKKAANDLEAARRFLAVREECPFDTVCFHCQQAVEKALKAWMTRRAKGLQIVNSWGRLPKRRQ